MPLDANGDNIYQVEVQACDSDSFCTSQIITITITDLDEDMDGFTGIADPDDNNPCVPDNTVNNCCEAEAPTITKD